MSADVSGSSRRSYEWFQESSSRRACGPSRCQGSPSDSTTGSSVAGPGLKPSNTPQRADLNEFRSSESRAVGGIVRAFRACSAGRLQGCIKGAKARSRTRAVRPEQRRASQREQQGRSLPQFCQPSAMRARRSFRPPRAGPIPRSWQFGVQAGPEPPQGCTEPRRRSPHTRSSRGRTRRASRSTPAAFPNSPCRS